ncbi:hypothetical protein EVAR_86634_1 [Eumeta japonica]|uniref:Uncharacterized protein n=1 Tax=Eumeta variegata TaxID=151549 RepID=A0A4C1Z3V1_EUMVA|nr:hypothetical protein EVAR_86634_1 [Eumeta japonica]
MSECASHMVLYILLDSKQMAEHVSLLPDALDTGLHSRRRTAPSEKETDPVSRLLDIGLSQISPPGTVIQQLSAMSFRLLVYFFAERTNS